MSGQSGGRDQVALLKQAFLKIERLKAKLDRAERRRREPIAIVGIGCRFPGGADSPRAFWELLREGRDTTGEVPAERWDADAYYDPDPDAPGKMYTRRAAFIDGFDRFDPRFFSITPREADGMDPQQRLLLEVSWQALEHAGIPPHTLVGSDTGVFVGISGTDYAHVSARAARTQAPDIYAATGNSFSIAAGRISYTLGVQGPCAAIDTSCSSSLVAAHTAMRALRNEECRIALVGGVNLIIEPTTTVVLCKGQMLAPDGRCKTFDEKADGYVRGEGAGVVVLKRLSDAEADGDRILAVLRGSAINQDGASSGLTAPNGLAQEKVLRAALADAGLSAEEIDVVEAHGTGTSLGDPIEIRALGAAMVGERERPLFVGSVKTNIGHLESAAGIAGLIKATLALHHGELPPHLNFETPSPHIPWDEVAIEVPTALATLPRHDDRPTRIGVSSFGFSGTNAHAILESAPESAAVEPAPGPYVLPLSAKSDGAFADLVERYERLLETTEAPAAAIAYSASAGRTHFGRRAAVVGDDAAAWRAALAGVEAQRVGARPRVAWLFTGQGAQYVGMGRELHATEPRFREILDRCDALFAEAVGESLLPVIFPEPGEEQAAREKLDRTGFTQPALFALEAALAEMWLGWGLQPAAVAGHSVGEYAAAYVAGLFDLETGLRLIAERARRMQALPSGGKMAAVFADEATTREGIERFERLAIAALNGPRNTVISGDGAEVDRALAAFAEGGVKARALVVSHAFHSPLMDPMLDDFERFAGEQRFNDSLRFRLISNVTGESAKAAELGNADYWRRHVREAVRFEPSLQALAAAGCDTFLEIGPKPVLAGMGARCLDGARWIASLREGRDERTTVAQALATLYTAGADVDWEAVHRHARQVVELPGYPFERNRHWVAGDAAPEPVAIEPSAPSVSAGPAAYELVWQPDRAEATACPRRWLICADRTGVGQRVVTSLREHGDAVVAIQRGGPAPDGTRSIAAGDRAAFAEALDEAFAADEAVGVVWLWGLDAVRGDARPEALREAHREAIAPLLALLERLDDPSRARAWLVTRGIHGESGAGAAAMFQAPLAGLVRSLAVERPGLFAAHIDLDVAGDQEQEALALVESLSASPREELISLEDHQRRVARLQRAEAPPARLQLDADGAYLITGGHGALGQAVARRLIERGAGEVVLASRREVDAGDGMRSIALDVSDADAVDAAIREIPNLKGVVHAAGLLDDATLDALDVERFDRVLAAKAIGGWNLHRATADLELDFFVVFGSIAGVLGSPGQANYAAANAAIDALARYRCGSGLPALAIDWGPWSGEGMVAAAGLDEQRLARSGLTPLEPSVALDWFERLVAHGMPQALVVDADWKRLAASGSAALLDELAGESVVAAPAAEKAASPRERYAACPPDRRRPLLERYLAERVGAIVDLAPESIEADADLMELGLDSLMVMELVNALKRDFDLSLYAREIFEHASLAALAAYVEAELGEARLPSVAAVPQEHYEAPTPTIEPGAEGERNPPALFLLSSPRSGSTLLRVMLAGHPGLFSPPELHLLGFETLAERRDALGASQLDQGLQRALMELVDADAAAAEATIAGWIDEGFTVGRAYAELQRLAAPRMLVDKSPTYAGTIETLERAEQLFDGARYLLLVRHPYSVIESFVRKRMDRLGGVESGDPGVLAERIWTESNGNALELFRAIDPSRCQVVHYEALVRDPEGSAREILDALGLPYDPAVLDPYGGERMTDGVHESSMGIGDPGFLERRAIDPALAEVWRSIDLGRKLGGAARRIAEELGYELPREGRSRVALTRSEIRPIPRGGPLPLSFTQERLWFIEQLEPGNPVYNMRGFCFRLRGEFDETRFAEALDALVARHESLRTRFADEGGTAVAIVDPDARATLDLVDAASAADAQARLAEEMNRPFDLAAGPLFRAVVVRIGADERLLGLPMHHIVSDGWSMGVIAGELAALYRGETLPPLELQFADYAAWQRERLSGERVERLLDWWRERLAGDLPLAALPADRPRPARQSYRGARAFFELPVELNEALKRVAREQGATLYHTLLAAFNVLLHRYSGQDDLLVGSPVANRDVPGVERIVGFFVNTLVMRTAVEPELRFDELLTRVREGALGAYEHQQLPFERLVEELAPDRAMSHHPLFQVMFTLQPARLDPPRFGEATTEPLQVSQETAHFDLSLFLWDQGEGMAGLFEYSTDLFEPETIERMRGHLQQLLEGIADDPQARIDSYPLLGEDEAARIESWNATERAYPVGTLHGFIEAQVDRTPDATALCFEGRSMSYRELDRRANRLAHLLRTRGVGRDELVGVAMERSFEMVVSLLAILKAGGAYVPLDPDYPAERLQAMIEDAGTDLILTQSHLAEGLPASRATRFAVDAEAAAIAAQPAERPGAVTSPGQLAYTIFTSGSTGRPKGAMNEHRGIVNRLHWMQEAFELGAGDTVLQKTPFSFDVSVWEFFWPLMTGARLVLARPGGHKDTQYLARLIAEERVTTLHFVPSMLQAFLDEPTIDRCRGVLRRVICSGEALPLELTRRFFAASDAELHNLYGPTEAAVDVTWWPCERDGELGTVPIGRPIANTQIHILDERMRPVPIGVPGELYIGGVQVARGYRNRPELTEERFVRDPFRSGGARLYRTGDLARWHADGWVEFLGRVDFQVKLRGFRIELGEIESVLVEHPAVREAVVVARDDLGDDLRLVAYVVGESDDLRAHLAGKLPDYMVPGLFVTLDALPLSPNGKVDRKALPRPELGRDEQLEFVEPRDELEALVAGVWADVIGIERVGATDDFFALGGHSLLATQVASRLRDAAAVELPLRTLFEATTVETLARELRAQSGASRPRRGQPEPVPRDRPLPLSYAQRRLWYLDQLDPGTTAFNLPGALRLDGELDEAALAAALATIVDRHEALRTRFVEIDGEPRQLIDPPGKFALDRIDLSGRPEAAAEHLAAESRRPFDLANGPLLRAQLLRVDPDSHLLVLNMHHIVSDGWSMGIFIDELAAHYRGDSLPPLEIQYADYAVWQQSWLSGEVLDEQLGYWRERLAGVPTALQLPLDRPRPPFQSYRGAKIPVRLGARVRDGLERIGRDEGATLFMTLLAGLGALLARSCRAEEFCVGSPIAGRQHPGSEKLIGFFTNMLALRCDVGGRPSFRELLRRCREETLGAYDHQDLPFEKLVEELQPLRDTSLHPLFQVMLVLQNAPAGTLELPRLTLTPVEGDRGGAQLDLSLYLTESEAGLAGNLEYATDLFDAQSVERLMARFERLLESAIAEPDRPVDELGWLDAGERQALLTRWNATDGRFASERRLHQGFELQADARPEATAVSCAGRSVSYGELDRRANRLARHLQSKGVGAGTIVGVYLERSIEMVEALLAVLKAGGAYLPLDPSFPAERLEFMLADAGVNLLVTQKTLAEDAPAGAQHTVRIDGDREAIERHPDSRPEPVGTPDDRAYVIYTSGSTGTPKGVEIPHRAVANFLDAMIAEPGLAADDVLLSVTTLSFDISVLEIFGPLTAGAEVAVVPRESAADGEALIAALADSGATVMQATPITWRLMLAAGWEGDPRLKALCGGEALSRDLADALLSRVASLWNMYGPTETTIWSSVDRVESGDGAIPIGLPIANTTFHVLDERLQPVPLGVPGELWIGGDGLALGYLGRPELTAERFVPDPFAARAGARIYRTGDLVRRREDGRLEFGGRADFQIKIRGFRVELGEIESALERLDAVREAVVLAREDRPGDQRLVGYVIAEGEAPSAAELQQALRAELPDYMVPGAFVLLESFPQTPNRKVDRNALPAPEIGADRELVAPRDDAERAVVAIWSEVLGLEEISVHDSFFDLGGHSLLATQVLARLRERHGAELSLRAIFEASTAAALAERLGPPSDEVAEIDGPRVLPRDRPLPLSFAQSRLWYLDRLDPGTHAFNLAGALMLEGALDRDALRRALTTIVERHEALRTRFAEQDGEPVQLIDPPGRFAPEESDLCDVAPDERGAEVLRRVEAESRRPFDLGAGPLFRAHLCKLDPRRHVLIVNMHHIVSDGWSIGVLVRELVDLYAAFVDGRPAGLAPLDYQYADFAVWQREWLAGGETLERELDYWRETLAGAPTALQLPTDRPRPAFQSYHGAKLPVTLSPEIVDGLRKLARDEGATLYMALLAGWASLLARYSRSEDLCIGAPIANRRLAGLEGLIGFFANMLALRCDVSGQPSFRELLARLRDTTLGAYDHQDIPFEKLVEELQPARDTSVHPLFQVMLVLQNAPLQPLEMPGLSLRPIEVDRAAAQLDLALYLREENDGIVGYLEYSTDLFDEATMRRLMAHFERVLAGVLDDPAAPAEAVALLSDAERRLQLERWNDTAAEYDRALFLHERFELEAARNPEAIAVGFEGATLGYGELDRRSDALAAQLRSYGVGIDTLVGVHLERSPEMVVALLGVLKAGGAYVPLDPSFPAERLSFMLEDSGAPILITHSRLVDDAPAGAMRTVLIDGEREPSGAVTPLEGRDPARDRAYVIYTSGSTGKPKGVEISHRAVGNFLEAMAREPGLDADDVLLSVTTLSFDISVLEIFGPLAVGARVELVSRESAADGRALIEALERSQATVMQATPITWRLLVESGWAGDPRLKLLCGGEVLSRDLADQLLGRCRSLWNMYGPTETTIWSAVDRVEAGEESVAVGHPIANTAFYVLDERREPVPIGVPGELYIGGDGLANGYLGRAELTAERFVDDPFVDAPDARMYRTGDLVRFRTDGRLEFLGRADFQIKIRGFRVELGEIEVALNRLAEVRESVVLVREDRPGDQRLVGYVIAEGAAPEPSSLQERLRADLPDYMVPSAFVFLDSFPQTPNRKVDRKALPAPAGLAAREAVVAPRTPLEALLAEVWRDVLGVEEPSVHASFFDLGGHSLLATQVVSRLRAAVGIELPLREIFEAPTIAQLAERMQRHRAVEGLDEGPRPAPRDAPLPLSFAQNRLWYLDQLEPGGSAFNLAGALELDGKLDVEALERALTTIVERHESLRTRFGDHEGSPIQIVDPAERFAVEHLDLGEAGAGARDAELRRLLAEASTRSFDLAEGPLFRARLIRLEERRHALIVEMHHIVSDGWSIGVFVRELVELYEANVEGRAPQLDALPFQYADFAIWQREWLAGERLEAQLAFWRERLAGAPPALELPTDRPRPPFQSYRGARLPVRFSRELTEGLHALAGAEGATLYMTLLAGFAALLQRYCRTDDIPIGSPIANRNHPGLEGLIGFFANTLVLRCDLSGRPSFRELLRRVREQTLGAYDHQDLPFEKLVEELQPVRDTSLHPFFQAMLVLQNAPQRELALPGLTLRPIEGDRAAAQLDLSLYLREELDGLAGDLEYSTDLFERSTLERLTAHFQRLLEGALADPDAPLDTLSLLSPDERRAVLVEPNATEREFDAERLLHQGLERIADREPDRVAVRFEGEEISYGELDRRANRLAHRLRELGVEADTLVGVHLERSIEMVEALFGVLKAGGAYVPLDPSFPAERLAFMLEDSEAAVMITDSRLEPTAPTGARHVVLIDDAGEASDERPAPVNSSRDRAYVIYTSGSTGKPKGVEIPHRAVGNFLEAMAREPGLEPDDVLLSVTTLSFDISVLEIFGPLSCGATVELVSRECAADGDALIEALAASGATVMQATPITWRLMIEAGWSGDPRLKVLCGGEALPRDLADALLARSESLWNMYGPTETTIWSSVDRVTAGEGDVRVGAPIANTRFYVLDERREPVPPGVPGELYIGGDGLARGYLARPELTAERFLPDPFVEGARIYRTGDLVRQQDDGRLRFLGRADFQIKIRGFRVELGEIEAALARDARVREAVVLVREDRPGDQRLVAYVIPEGQAPEHGALQTTLRAELPDYMVPSAFVFLESFPQTPNRKVDRNALPAPEGLAARAELVAPRNAVERALAEIWCDVLALEELSVHDNFFELGGHSLLATQVVARVRERERIELPLRAIFETPTIAGLAERLGAAPVRAIEDDEGPQPVPRDCPLPLSFAQSRLWYLDQLEPGGTAFNLTGALELKGALDVPALEHALTTIVERHESLRTRFIEVDGEPLQVIAPPSSFSLELVELAEPDPAERLAEARQRVALQSRTPFDLEAGPLFRAQLLRLDNDHHVFVAGMHHIVSDGWSIGVFVNELVELYDARLAEREARLPRLAYQYADVAVWQQQRLSGERLAQQLDYWRGRLAGAPAALQLPTDRPRPTFQSYRGAKLPVRFPRPLLEGLERIGAGEGATLYMSLLAAFSVLLHRYCRSDDVLVGSPIANRAHPGMEPLIGFFANTLVLRCDVGGEPSFRELLRRVRSETLGAYEHQDVPFEKLVEELQPVRDTSIHPLFQVMLVLQNAPLSELELSGLTLAPLEIDRAAAQVDLSLYLRESADGLDGALEYSTDLFDEPTVRRMMGHFSRLLEGIVADPDRAVAEIPILPGSERQLQLERWNDTSMPFDEARLLHQGFERAADEHPTATAVAFDSDEVSYAELERRANRLARRLRAAGVGADTLVGIHLERSVELVEALLGVLKAGGAYLPLDPSFPAERLEFMLADARAPVMITDSTLAEMAPAGAAETILIDDRQALDALDDSRPEPLSCATDRAYVIYTSGSTGKPKGVEIQHRAVANFLEAMAAEPGLGASDVLLSVTTLSFDISVLEIFGPLTVGAKVVLVDKESAADGMRLMAALSSSGATVMQATPITWRLLLESGWPGDDRLKVLCGGEALSRELADELLERSGSLWNMYGPTETTIWSAVDRVEPDDGPVRVGRPIANTRFYVLDERREPVPLGVPGELYIGGDGLARGYLDRVELTAERFVEDPFDGRRGARMYRTGDLVRLATDGRLEFLGRIDFQIKIRGFRVELGEIEAALDRHPAVREAVVLAREDRPGDQRLVAYVVPEGEAVEAPTLQEAVRVDLPDYMVPTAFVFLERFPQTPNRKIDRKALPAPEGPAERAAVVAPRTPLERVLASVWSEVLDLEVISVHDNFFDLGGHSLLSMKVVARVEERAGFRMTPGELIYQSLEQVAATYADRMADEPGAAAAQHEASEEPKAPKRLGPLRRVLSFVTRK